jgi:choice-of-anchor B domain-containing protein
MRRLFLILLASIPFAAIGQAQMDTLRHLNIKPGGGYSATWGYVDPDGREYAIIGCNGSGGQQPGTAFVDITDNANMRLAGFVPGPASSWREMKTYDHYAYVVTEAGGSGTQIIDLSYLPDSVHLVRTFVYTLGANNTAKSHTITISDGFMYLNGCANWNPGGMVIFDLRTDPTSPVYVGQYQPEYIHDSYVLRDTIYGAAVYGGGGLYIANARNKSNVQTIGKIIYPGSGTHNAWVTRSRRFVISTDEIGSTPKTLKFWDIGSLPTIPSLPTATFTSSPADIVHNVTVRGDYAYVAWYTLGAVVVNIADPANPQLAGNYDTSTQTPGSYNGMWGIYPYFPSGKIVGGDMQNGLWVFRFSGLSPRQRPQLLAPTDGDTLRQNPPTQFRWTKAADQSADPHYYQLHIWGPGVDTLLHADDSTLTLSPLVGYQIGQRYQWHVWTKDEFTAVTSADTFSFVYRTPTDVGGEEGEKPKDFALDQNYPNPFNPSTRIAYSLPSSMHVRIEVYSVLGEKVADLVNGVEAGGNHSVVFDATGMTSGMYFCRMTAGTFVATRKMTILR